jgi:hypothetical protein
MITRYAPAFIDGLFSEGDLTTLHQVISVIETARSLPEEYWLFCRVIEWTGSERSGIWQYYESLTEAQFDRVSSGLIRFGFAEVAEIYRSGRNQWQDERKMADLDAWLRANSGWLEAAMLELIRPHRGLLKAQ